LLANAKRPAADAGLIDSMGVTATFLDALDVPAHQAFKGISALRSGRDAVVSENCGHGNADLARRDIYFTVTTDAHRMMAVMRDADLWIEQLYDRRADPRELRNIVESPGCRPAVAAMVQQLYRERAEIFGLRNCKVFCLPTDPHRKIFIN